MESGTLETASSFAIAALVAAGSEERAAKLMVADAALFVHSEAFYKAKKSTFTFHYPQALYIYILIIKRKHTH